jgi:hypothetical protein
VDVPEDVDAVLSQLLREARASFGDGDAETGVAAVTTAATVATNKLPESQLRAQIRHGCERAEAVAVTEDSDLQAAAEYVAAIERRLDEATGA